MLALVERVGDLLDDPVGHRAVDLAGQLDEARVQAVLARLPGQVERIDRDAVPAEAGTRIVGHEAERLGGGRADDLVDVDAHPVGDDLHLVDEADVDRAVDVLQQLGQLGGLGRAHRHDRVDHLAVERDADLEAGRRDAAADLRESCGC